MLHSPNDHNWNNLIKTNINLKALHDLLLKLSIFLAIYDAALLWIYFSVRKVSLSIHNVFMIGANEHAISELREKESWFMAHGKAISLFDDVYEFIQLFRQEQCRVIGWNGLFTHDYHQKRHNIGPRLGNFHVEIESSTVRKQQTLHFYLCRCPWRDRWQGQQLFFPSPVYQQVWIFNDVASLSFAFYSHSS